MTRLMITLATGAVLGGGLAALPVAATAQAGQTTIVVFGNDPCPREYICIRKGDSDRYRLPKDQQLQGTRQQRRSWANKAQELTTVGDTGSTGCSAVGPGGYNGCLVKEIQQAKQAAKEQQESGQPPR